MVDVFTETIIKCPCGRVAAFAANPDHVPEWYVNIKSVEWKTEKPLSIGSLIAFKAHFLGRQLSYIYEVTEYIPGQKLVMKTADGPFPMETTYSWESLGDNLTRMTLRNKGNPTGFSKFITPFMSSMIKRANEKDLRKLKEVLETQKRG